MRFSIQICSAMPFQTAKDTASNSYEAMIYVPKVADIQELATKTEYISDDSLRMEFLNGNRKCHQCQAKQKQLPDN